MRGTYYILIPPRVLMIGNEPTLATCATPRETTPCSSSGARGAIGNHYPTHYHLRLVPPDIDYQVLDPGTDD